MQKDESVDTKKTEAQDDQKQIHPEIPKDREEKDQYTAGKYDERHSREQSPMQDSRSGAGA